MMGRRSAETAVKSADNQLEVAQREAHARRARQGRTLAATPNLDRARASVTSA